MTVHRPVRPAWTCGACGAEWPCQPQRQALLADYGRAPIALSLYLAAHYLDAVPELPDVPVAQLYRRFLGWARCASTRPTPDIAESRTGPDADEPQPDADEPLRNVRGVPRST
ncbi:hypothetical protein [Micromonospora yangpuensis]|uniref:Flavin reductase n=1 Tax=Micromonospora yangpuensis TaxID=683228 RepID=A0A1C6VDA3_9ACTN|nr:hypothetical protein [Micromonospora yangpuensis]GGM12628.1 hypothetical protein GCM10012279_33430 [Micromonospora yangpuensis]SCL63800.1 hypothetical protein GA0070617_5302 [Micromonospora yangpuensis]